MSTDPEPGTTPTTPDHGPDSSPDRTTDPGPGRTTDPTPGTRRATTTPGAMRSTRVRPYAITRGRTRPRHLLLVETLVSVPNYDPQAAAQMMPESQAIYERARQRTSVAELSAHLDISLGVIRVLLSDLIAQDMVYVHPTGHEYQYDLSLLERILDGLKGV